ncbi:MAG: hypothetical protein LBR85_06650 [Oscillospiraceae bacterium]|jgi:hypothetical protein|nr:hypothetical protein [Oscillospiraceae bacterium]
MYRATKKLIQKQADSIIPDKWAEIKEVALNSLPPLQTPVTSVHRKQRTITALATCVCSAIILIAVFAARGIDNGVLPEPKQNPIDPSSVPEQTQAPSDAHVTTVPSGTDVIHWNTSDGVPQGRVRIAGTFEKLPFEQWQDYFDLSFSTDEPISYSLVYSIPKYDEPVFLMCGNVNIEYGEEQWLSAYIHDSKSYRRLADFTQGDELISTIGNAELILLKYSGYQNKVGQIKLDSHWITFESHGFSDEMIISFIKSINEL